VTDVAFYVATHPDDALIFRGDQLWADGHLFGTHLVHVTVSAGDAGRVDGWWQQREAGTIAALGATQSPAAGTGGAVTAGVNGHAVARYAGCGWTAYCLRLPDGGLDANGFDSTGHATLTKLANGSIPSIAAVDGSTSYSGWDDLCATLRALFSLERAAGTTAAPWINAADPDRVSSPGDHPDHYAASEAVRSVAVHDGYQRAWWVSYDVRNRPADVQGFSLAQKRFLFEAYGWQTGGPNEDEWGWWGPKRYDRTE
jgi:hypothetical protein